MEQPQLIEQLKSEDGFRSGHISEDKVHVHWWVERCGKILEISTPVDTYEEVLDNILMVVENKECADREPDITTFGQVAMWETR